MTTLATPIPIAQLQPGLDPEATSVTGIVTLIWPYASSTQSLSLLLVEPDFRLRRHRGQVRIHFNGASAKAVAKSGVTIGDRLSLSLKGSEWARDGPVATTPGKGIEWELRYGESVVLQVQRDPQAPVLLEIDRSALSPESAADATQPRLSPVYSSHIATPTTRAPLLNAHTWESPAFLKRSRFISSCDPLALDEEDDFPDNNRRKRVKFGQGSGLWRFADKTPSPDREPDRDDFAVVNPPQPQPDESLPPNVADRKQQSSEKIDLIAEIQDDEQGIPTLTEDANEEAGADRQPSEEGQHIHEVTRSVYEKTATNAPPSPSSTNAELSVAAMSERNTLIKGATTPSSKSAYSVSATSKSDQESESEAEAEAESDYSDSAAFGASNFGLNGPLVPRDQYPRNERSNINLVIKEARSMNLDKVNHSPEEAPSPSVSAGGQDYPGHAIKPVTIKESAHEFQVLDGNDSVPGQEHDSIERGTQGFSSVPPSPSRQRSEQLTSETPIFPYISEMPLDVKQQGHQSDKTPSYKDGRATSVEEPSTSQPAPAESQEVRKGKVETTTYPPSPRVSKVEIIDLEGDDDDGDEAHLISQQPAWLPSTESTAPIVENLTQYHDSLTPTGTADPSEPLPPRSCTPSPSVTDRPRDSIAQPDSVTERPPAYIGGRSPATATSNDSSVEKASDDFLQPDTSAGQPRSRKEPFYLAPRADLSKILKQDLGLQNDPIPQNRRLEPEIGVRHDSSCESATPRPEDAGQFEDRAPNTQSTETRDPEKVGQLVERKVETQDSFVVLPVTVQDSVQVLSPRSQLPTPDTTQPASFTSQPSLSSLKSMSDDDTLPTPRLTQGKSVDLVLPIALQVATEPSQGTSPSPSHKHQSLVEEKHSPAKVSTSQRPPTLIEKLKAMKRLSSQTPQKGGDASAVSPWFAPRRSSIIVPDSEAGSEVESMSEGDRKSTKQNGTAKLQTPEKQTFLAKSFIRSPSQWEDIQPITPSPGYNPPSQPPPPGFRTSLSYFVPLATLQSHFNLAVDILAIALLATPIVRAATGAKDYYQTIYIADPSSSVLRSPLITVQIFRSHNKCFPSLKEGDALLLRDFKVQSFHRQLSLLSTQSSAWAVFRRDADVQVRGPPVEFGAEERGFARGLWRWWAGLDRKVKASLIDIAPKDKHERAMPADNKLDGRVPFKEKRLDKYNENSLVKLKKEGIAGLGVDLPGSQDKIGNEITKDNSREAIFDLSSSQENTRIPSLKGRSSGPDGVLESIEPPKRVLRPRGARGMAERSESPLKAMNRRSGTVFTGGLGEPESE